MTPVVLLPDAFFGCHVIEEYLIQRKFTGNNNQGFYGQARGVHDPLFVC